MNSTERSADKRHEIDLVAVWQAAWQHKLVVAATAALCVALALFIALTATPIFRAEAIVTEVRESGVGSSGGLASELGGLASLAGVNLGALGENHDREAVLESRYLVEEFVKRNSVLPLMARNSKKPLNLWSTVELFRKGVVTITEDKLKGTTSVSIDWTDPLTAARWANGFVGLANELIRRKAIDDASRNVEYLNKQITQTNVLAVQQAMYNLIESETKTLMLANARREYAFTLVDPAVAPEIRISPRRTLIVLTGGMVGLLLGAIVAFAYDRWRRRRHAAIMTTAAAFQGH